ncbi:MAG: hypothetical protein JW838_10675 [Spirochaetes bacterium]|nr:hypothetical protein [Spirochaetota bacterium]
MITRAGVIAFLVMLSTATMAAREGSAPVDSVDWTRGVVVSHGTGRVMISEKGRPLERYGRQAISLNRGRIEAYRAARDRAVEKMYRLLGRVRIDADTLLDELLERDPIFQSRITDVVSERTRFREFPVGFDGSGCSAELRIGDILLAVPYRYPEEPFPSRIDNPIPTDYTSLVIDARGLGVEPMILPSVFDENGLEVYGRHMVDIRHATRFGIVRYAGTEDEAMGHRVAGDRPYYTVALRNLKGCPVLADRDVRKILSSARTLENLKKCRVIFIIGQIEN